MPQSVIDEITLGLRRLGVRPVGNSFRITLALRCGMYSNSKILYTLNKNLKRVDTRQSIKMC